MGILDKMFGKSKPSTPKARDLTSPESMAEEKAYRAEKARREKERFDRKIKKAEQRGRDRATPFTEKAEKAFVVTGKAIGGFVTSPGFQRFARAGASITQGRPYRKKKSKKSKKQGGITVTINDGGSSKKSRKSRRREMRHDPLAIGNIWG